MKVGLRVRPLLGREIQSNECVKCFKDNNQVLLGTEKNFTYDALFDQNSLQQDVFEKCVKNLVLGCFLG